MMDGISVNALQFEASVMNEPVINSRAGLYIYLNAMVCFGICIYPDVTLLGKKSFYC